jgi:hypothetical protein
LLVRRLPISIINSNGKVLQLESLKSIIRSRYVAGDPCSIVYTFSDALVNTYGFPCWNLVYWRWRLGMSRKNGSIVYTIPAAIVENIMVFHAGVQCIDIGFWGHVDLTQ